MPTTAVVLLSGGLDSMLAVRLLQDQGLTVEAINFRTQFACCQQQAALAARELCVRMTVIAESDDYLEVIKHPRHGYGRGANPCLDCRIHMFQKAARLADEFGAVVVASGEVVGQRPMSQKKRDLALIAHRAGLEDRLLRPLSALLLPPTLAEREGLVDRERLFGFSGRGRRGLIALAQQLGFARIPQPSSGCALTNPEFGKKVFQLLAHQPLAGRWDFELLQVGRHLALDDRHQLILGRRAEENARLEALAERPDAEKCLLLRPRGFVGPTGLVIGPTPERWALHAGQQMLRHAQGAPERGTIEAQGAETCQTFEAA